MIGIALIPGLLAMWLYYVGLRRTAASRATLAELAYPCTAAVVGVALLDAHLSAANGWAPHWWSVPSPHCPARGAGRRAVGAGRARAVDDRLDGPPPAAGGVARRRADVALTAACTGGRRRCGRRPVGHSAKRRGHHGGDTAESSADGT